MIVLEMCNFGGGEILYVCLQESLDKFLFCIVFYYGFILLKLVYSYFVVVLVEVGFWVIMLDVLEYGVCYQGDEVGWMQCFWLILQQNFREFFVLCEVIIVEGWLEGEWLVVVGVLMGGMMVLGIMMYYFELNSVVCLMGLGYFCFLL